MYAILLHLYVYIVYVQYYIAASRKIRSNEPILRNSGQISGRYISLQTMGYARQFIDFSF